MRRVQVLAIVGAAVGLLWSGRLWAQEQVEILGGREYWLGFPHSWVYPTETARGISALQLWVASREPAKVQVYLNGGQTLYQEFTTKPKQTFVVAIPMDHMNIDAGVVQDKGIRVVANKPIVVTGYVSFTISGEAFMCIPIEALGKRYYTLNMYQDCVGNEYRPAQILIIATRDNTVVRYYPTTETSDGVKPGQYGEIRLNRGQTYLIKAKIDARYNQDWKTDLTGTYIEATEPIAVISGHTKGSYPRYSCTMLGTPAHFMRNSLMDMMWPVELWGTMYVSAPIMYKNRPRNGVDIDDAGDLIRFVASEDGTIIEQLRQDGSQEWQQISPPLRRGQWFNISAQEYAAAYRANKPILVGQYGKAWRLTPVNPLVGKDIEEPQNPPRNGEGMLMCLTPRERWATYTTFYSPPGMDNFFMITFETARMDDIYFDGVRLRNKFSGGIKPVQGTPYSYVVAAVTPGDHTVEGKNGAQFAVYAYGNLDLSKSGFAYGYPTGINYAVRCEDTVLISDREECGNITGQVEVRPLGSETECARLFSVALDSAVNYELVLPETFRPSYDRQTTFEIRVVDPQQDAYAVLEVITRSGKRIVREYRYVAEAVVAEPPIVDFGVQSFGQAVERTIVVRNVKPRQVAIKRLYLRLGLAEFSIVEPTSFPIVLQPAGQPGDRVDVRIRATAQLAQERVDTLYAELSCYPEPLAPVKLRGNEPIMWVDDADFGAVPLGTERMRLVRIESRGQLPLEITAVDWPDKTHFRTEGLLEVLPLRLEPGQSYEFRVYYKPTVEGATDQTRAVFTTNATKVKLYSDWKGTGIVANVTIQGYDWGARRVADAYAQLDDPRYGYRGQVVITATGNTPLNNVDVTVEDDPQYPGDRLAFYVDKTGLPPQLQPGQRVTLTAYFKPTEERAYRARVVVRGLDNNEWREASDELRGAGLQPHIAADGRDFGTLMVGQSKQDVAPVYSQGTMEVTVRDFEIVGPDADAFQVEPTFLQQVRTQGLRIPQGQSVEVPVIFTALRVGDHRANLRVISDAPETPEPELIGRGISQGLAATDYDFGRHFVTTRVDQPAAVFVRNTGAARVYVERIEKASGDINNFDLLTPAGFWIEPFSDYPIEVAFSPDAERRYEMRIRYVTNIGEAYSTVWGEGRRVYGVVRIGEYRTTPGQELDITVELTRHPNAALRAEDRDVTEGAIQEFEARVWYDERMLEPVLDVGAISTAGTLTEGWTVEYVQPLPKHLPPGGTEPMSAFQVKLTGTTPLRLAQDVNPLFRFRARSFLAPIDRSALPVQMVPLNRPYVVIEEQPGLLRLTVPCVENLRLVRLNPVGYSLQQVVPQPAQGEVQLRYSIGYSGWVRLELFNAMGERVAMLVDQEQPAGEYELTFNTRLFPAGVYYYRLISGPYTETRRLDILN